MPNLTELYGQTNKLMSDHKLEKWWERQADDPITDLPPTLTKSESEIELLDAQPTNRQHAVHCIAAISIDVNTKKEKTLLDAKKPEDITSWSAN